MKKGKLFLVPSPLGEDIALDTFLPASVFTICKDIKHFVIEKEKPARKFLKQLDLNHTQQELELFPLNKHIGKDEYQSYLKPALNGFNMGLLSDAGCPGVADPGAEIVQIAHQQGIQVVPITGPSSILLALMGSGFSGQHFAFNGYLPIKDNEKKKAIRSFEIESKKKGQSQIFIETPYRNEALLKTLINSLNPDTELCVAVNLTTPEERIISKPVYLWKSNDLNLHKKPAVFIFYCGHSVSQKQVVDRDLNIQRW